MEAEKYKYTQESERYKRMNKFYITATSLIGIILNVGKISIIFNSDAVNSAKEEHDNVKKILDNMLVISKTVGEETDASTNLMNELVTTTETVTGHMKEITDATNMTANSIEEQNMMTNSIQQAIEHAGEVS